MRQLPPIPVLRVGQPQQVPQALQALQEPLEQLGLLVPLDLQVPLVILALLEQLEQLVHKVLLMKHPIIKFIT